MKTRLTTGAARVFYALFSLCFAWLTVHILTGSFYAYHEVRLLCCAACALALLALCWQAIKKHEAWLAGHSTAITLGFLIFMALLQMVFGMLLRYKPVYDVDAIYGGAIEWAETGTFASYYEYYSYFFNNFGALRFFSWVFRLTRALGGSDYFAAATGVNCVLSLCTMYVTGAVGQELLGTRGRFMAYVLFLFSPPFYFIAPAFYTDALSMLFPVLIYWLYLLAKRARRSHIQILLYCLMGLAAAFGIQLKPTVAIALVAVAIDAALTWRWKRTTAMTAIVLLLVLLGQTEMNAAMLRHLDGETVEQNSTPVLHWVMMGLTGNGMYNAEDYEFTRSFTDPNERDAALKAEIQARIQSLGAEGLVEFFTAKGEICFGDGTYGLVDCLNGEIEERTWLHELVLQDGEYYDLYKHVCTGVLLALYVLMIAAGVRELFLPGTEPRRALAPRLAVFGLLLFLLCWEARWRYFSGYIPMIFLSALPGLEPLARGAAQARLLLRRSGTICSKEEQAGKM